MLRTGFLEAINSIFSHGIYFIWIEAYFEDFALLFLMKNLSQ